MLKKADQRTADPAAREMLEVSDREGYETIWDRLESQSPQCRLGQEGVCCRICSMGPCRINLSGKKPDRGVCGADADTIVARNLIRMIAAGASSHSDHGRKPALLLKEVAAGRNGQYAVKDPAKLMAVAARLGVATAGRTVAEVAGDVADVALDCFGAQDSGPFRFAECYMPVRRLERLREVEALLAGPEGRHFGLLPRSIDREPVDVLHRTHFGTDHDPLSLLVQGVRCALADGWGGSMIATELQDVLFGTPRVKSAEANLGVIDEEYVNIVVHGHEPIFSEALIDCALGEEMQEAARKIGAKGVKIIGMCCTINEIMMRKGVAVAGNHLHQELAVMTGAIEAVVVDVQCILPSMVNLTRCFHTRFITTSEQALFPGAIHIQFEESRSLEISRKVVESAIEVFPRRNPAKVYIPQHVVPARVGYSVEEITSHLGGSLAPLAEALKSGRIRGIVSVVGCNNPKITQDYLHVSLAKELIRNDVLVLGTGCSAIAVAKAGLMAMETVESASAGLQGFCKEFGIPPILHMGSCVDCSRMLVLLGSLADHLGVDMAEVPAVGSAPEWTTEKAISIGTYLVGSGIPVHLGHMPPIAGSKVVTELLTEGVRDLLGGFFFVEGNPDLTVERMLSILEERRQKLPGARAIPSKGNPASSPSSVPATDAACTTEAKA